VSDKYLSSEPTEVQSNDSSEQLWVKLQVKGAPDLYIGSFYKPPKITDDEKIAPSRGRHENFGGISCEKSRFYAKKSYFFQLRRG
jgi:hypothetical protein